MPRAPSGNGGARSRSTRNTRRPTSAWATRLYAQGRTAEALAHWRDGLQLQPNDPPALRRVAWVLATSPDAAIRDGAEAVAFAVRALELSGGKDAQVLDTLAAAYAEKGQFADAALTARRAQARAAQENQPALAHDIGVRIALYEAGQPFRDRVK